MKNIDILTSLFYVNDVASVYVKAMDVYDCRNAKTSTNIGQSLWSVVTGYVLEMSLRNSDSVPGRNVCYVMHCHKVRPSAFVAGDVAVAIPWGITCRKRESRKFVS